MEFIKKNLTVILLSVMCTLLLVVVILLVVDNNTFKFSNSTTKEDTLEKNIKTSKQSETKKEETKQEEIIKEEVKATKKEEAKAETKKEEAKVAPKQEEVVTPKVESKQEEKSEESLLSYLNSQTQLFSNRSESTGKLKEIFVSIIDFIFYDKEIKGYKFKELTNMAKLQVIDSALAIDKQIDTYFPDYKETIKDKYTSVKGTLALKYLDVTASFCSNYPKMCNQAKLNFNTMKSNYGFALDLAKELLKSGTSKVKELYENWKDK